MIALYISLGIIGLILMITLSIACVFHKGLFGKRWMPDGIVKYYSVSDFPGLNQKKVEFERKNTVLRGYIYSYECDNYKGILVFSHGMWGSHQAYVQEIERLARDGFLVLGFDYYGTDLSDGKNTRSMVESLISLDAAIKFVKKEYKNYDIYVMGHSWGGFASSNILNYHPDIKKIVTMAPFVSVKRLLCSLLPRKFWLFVPFLLMIEWFKSGKYAFSTAVKALKSTDKSVLVLQSTDDHLVKYDWHAKYLEEVIDNDNVEFLVVENRRHNPDYTIDAVKYIKDTNEEMKKYNGEDLINYRKSLDYKFMGSLDDEIFTKILNFLNTEEKYE